MSRDPRDVRELVYPGPIRDYPRPLQPQDLTLLGAKPIRLTGQITPAQISNVPCLLTMITLSGGAVASNVRLFDSANLETTVPIGRVNCGIALFDGWSHSRGIIAYKGLVAQLDQADAEAFLYIITATG